ncbi:MAG: GAF domain-containing protein [Pseudomonadota bacterium]
MATPNHTPAPPPAASHRAESEPDPFEFSADAFEVKVAEMLVATSDGSDALIDSSISDVLRLLRTQLKMDVVFVSEFADGKRHFRHVDQAAGKEVIARGECDPLEESWCMRVVDGRIPDFIADARVLQKSGVLSETPFPIGTHMSTPIYLKSGEVYGTLCCFSFAPSDELKARDMRTLRYTAKLAADRLEEGRAA